MLYFILCFGGLLGTWLAPGLNTEIQLLEYAGLAATGLSIIRGVFPYTKIQVCYFISTCVYVCVLCVLSLPFV